MTFRKLLCEAEELQGIKEVNSMNLEQFKERIIEADKDVQKLKDVFEEMFFEELTKSMIEVFMKRYEALADKESYIDKMLSRYKDFGELGFATIALNCFTEKRGVDNA